MSDAARDTRFEELERKLERTLEEVERLNEALADVVRIEPLLRALLKRAPSRRHQTPPKAPSDGVLTEEQKKEIRNRMRRKKS